MVLTFNVSCKFVADDIPNIITVFFFFFLIRFDFLCELSARKTVHMKCHALFSLEKMLSAADMIGTFS